MNVGCAETPLWERPGLRRAAGNTLRPGGFRLTDRAASFAGLAPGWRVLDVGSGLGATVNRLRSRYGVWAVGVELSGRQISNASGAGGMVRGNGADLPFVSNVFRAVFCECVLSLLPDPVAALKGFWRVLAPGGFLCLSDLYGVEHRTHGGGSCAEGAFGRQEIGEALEYCGFETRLFEDHTQLLKELAARLILGGEICDSDGGCGGRESGLGYFLVVAQKMEAGSC